MFILQRPLVLISWHWKKQESTDSKISLFLENIKNIISVVKISPYPTGLQNNGQENLKNNKNLVGVAH